MNRKLYRVAWKSPQTGVKGHGEWQGDKALVEAWVEDAKGEYPFLHHWLEETEERINANRSSWN